MRWAFLLLILAPWAAHAETIYLCKAYSGGMFWSNAPCGPQQATVDRMVNVPDGIPWDQKVALGEAARSQGQAVSNPQRVQSLPLGQATRQAECTQILRAIANLDGQMGVRPAGQTQDQQREQLQRLEDRRRALQC